MKIKLSLLLLCTQLFLFGQTIDSIAIKEVDSLILLSRSLTDEQDFDGAHATNDIAEKIALNKFGKESVTWGNTCFNHGRIFYFEGRYPEAEPWYLESKAIRGRLLGKDNPDYAKSLNNLALTYESMSQYETAEPLYLEAISIREKLLGKESGSYANALSNLAGLYMNLGEYEKSELMNVEAKDIRERVFGKAHPDYASSLNNLANLYIIIGNYDKAEPLYIESKAVREEMGDTASVDYATGIENFGILYQLMGKYEKSQQLLIDALELQKKILGKERHEYITCLTHLGDLYKSMGQYNKAENLFLEANAIGEKVLGKAHTDYAVNLMKLVDVYLTTGKYEKAIPLNITANEILESKLGKIHAYTVAGLESLAKLYYATGDYASAKPLFIAVSQINKELLLRASHHLSERELSAFAQKFNDQMRGDLSFAQVQPAMASTCYDDILFHKGFLLNAVQQIGKLATTEPIASEKYNRFKSYHRLLAAEYAKPFEERNGIAALETAANDLEKELARSVTGLAQAMRQVKWKEVQAALKPGEAAIEFVHYQYLNPNPTDSTNYVALVVLPDAKEPHFVLLFEKKQLLALLPKRNETGKLKIESLNKLYTAKAPSLYSLIWKPLEPLLNGVKTVYFSPSGLLHQLDIPAIGIPGEDGSMLADHYGLIDLGSTRQLVDIAKQTSLKHSDDDISTSGSEALFFGGIAYDMDSTTLAQAFISDGNAADGQLTAQRRGLEPGNNNAALRGGSWNALPWTEVEVVTLEKILTARGFKTKLLKGYAATEGAFKSINGNALPVVHLATHGFFYPDPSTMDKGGQQAEGGKVFKNSALPLMRSGLVLAGGNYAWQEGRPAKQGMEDGILTAYEISQMDMSHTELVVLSACETGLGDISGNEGVYGLQRAFKIAGAKYLIMSLWQVPDYQTQQLMSSFYGFWSDGKTSIPDAFRLAQKAMRTKFPDPFYWAGFLLVQ